MLEKKVNTSGRRSHKLRQFSHLWTLSSSNISVWIPGSWSITQVGDLSHDPPPLHSPCALFQFRTCVDDLSHVCEERRGCLASLLQPSAPLLATGAQSLRQINTGQPWEPCNICETRGPIDTPKLPQFRSVMQKMLILIRSSLGTQIFYLCRE